MRVMIAEDSGLLRQLLAGILQRHGHQVTGQASHTGQILPMIAAQPPDVVILDIRLPPGHSDEGLRAARDIRASHPAVGILVLSHYAETSYAVRLLENGSRGIGYLVKDRVQDTGRLLDAVRRVASGETVIDADIVRRLMGRRRDPDPLAGLTGSERQVLALMAEGLSNTAIAGRLFFSPKTVEKRATAITRKLGIPDIGYPGRSAVNVRVAAVLTYLRNSGLQAEGYPPYGHGLVVPRLSAGQSRRKGDSHGIQETCGRNGSRLGAGSGHRRRRIRRHFHRARPRGQRQQLRRARPRPTAAVCRGKRQRYPARNR